MGGLKLADGGVGWEWAHLLGGEWSGGGGVGVEDFLGLFVGKFEVGAVIFEKVRVVFHG